MKKFLFSLFVLGLTFSASAQVRINKTLQGVNFGSVQATLCSASVSVTVTNTSSTASVIIQTISVDNSAFAFTSRPGLPLTLPPSGAAAIGLMFCPQAQGWNYSQLAFATSGGKTSFTLVGLGLPAPPPPPPDTTPPSVSITSPAEGQSFAPGVITATASAIDDVGVVGVQFILDGTNFGAEETASPYTVAIDLSVLALGNHTIAARARDAAGNSATSIVVDFTIVAPSPASATPEFVQWRTSPTQNNVSSNVWKMRLPNPSPGGNMLLMACSWSTSTPTALAISDDHSNIWNTAIATNDDTNTQSAAIFYALNVASGTSLVTASWTAAVGNNMCWLSEVRNVATTAALDGMAGQVIASAMPSSGSLSTTNNGDLIVHFSFCDDCTGKRTYAAGSGFALRQVDDWSNAVLQTQVQSTAGPIAPIVTASASNRYISVAAAFKAAAAGNDLPAGIRVRGITVLVAPMNGSLAASMSFQVPTFTGNLLAVNWVDEDVTNPPTSITSSPANIFTNVPCPAVVATSTFQMRWVYIPSPALSSNMTIRFNYASTPSLAVVNAVYEISGADPTAPFDKCANANGDLEALSGTVTGPNLTPSTANGLIVVAVQQSGDTVTGFPSPVGANMDNMDAGIYTLITADQDGGYMNYRHPDTSAVQIKWTYSPYETPATNVGPWGSQAVAFKAPAAPK